jgi:hypothetical protein
VSGTERVPVPTNGHQPPLTDEDAVAVEPAAPGEAREAGRAVGPNPVVVGLPASPTQLAIGFGILVAVVAFLLRRQRPR